MKITIVTPQGELHNAEIDYAVITSQQNGEYAIMKNHIPIISTIDTGYVKMVTGEEKLYAVIINGVVEHQDNIINVIAQEAEVGLSEDESMAHLNKIREERLAENKRRNVDFATAERDLKKNVKKAKAGSL